MKRNYLLLIGLVIVLSFAGCAQKTNGPTDQETTGQVDDSNADENSADKENALSKDEEDVAQESADKESTPPADEATSEEGSNDSKKEVINDFDPETNSSEENFGLRYQIPSSWKKYVPDAPNALCYYAKDGMLMIHFQDKPSDSFDILANQEYIVDEVSKAIQDFSETGRSESKICESPSLSLTFTGTRKENEMTGNAVSFVTDTKLVLFLYTDWGDYDQSSDFAEIVNTITFVDNSKESEPTASTDAPSLDGTASSTAGQDNALNTAHSYLMVSPFSHSGLIRQLEFEGYSTEEATYAADNCGADWNEQAAKAAKNYLSISGFSYSGLVQQLEFEGYSTEEASYAVDNCGADWNEQAAKVAQNYLNIMSFSRSDLISQLEFDGFSYEQAEYGVSAVGY